jgi:hypothetical protein
MSSDGIFQPQAQFSQLALATDERLSSQRKLEIALVIQLLNQQ